MLTLHRHNKAYGYFIADKYEGETAHGVSSVDEIALNPDFLRKRTDRQSLSTLVHEMAHLWQQHHGKPPRRAYHNMEWANKMEDLGLIPSDTGAAGGKKTGQRVSHYIKQGGPYDRAYARLEATGFKLTWGSQPQAAKETKSGKRTKYVCGGCEAKAWAKEGLNIVCGDCDLEMIAA
jgi:predicted SprT family Zn-dependent metalloprotease